MRIAIPVSAHDSHLLPTKLKLLRHFGRLENHSISFSPAQSQVAACEKAANEISDLCPSIDILPLAFEGDGNWPQSPNLHWTLTMQTLILNGNREPVLWMELDFDPCEERWADKLEDAWRRGRKPMCGKIVPTPHRNAAGLIVTEPDDYMMMGCGIYAANLFGHPQQHIYTQGFRSNVNDQPFDVFLRGWLRQLGWSETDLIGDRWNTIGYQFADGQLTCSPAPSSFKNRDHSRTDILGAVAVHGCKDESFAKLILEHGSLSAMIGGQNQPQRPTTPRAPAPVAPQSIWSQVGGAPSSTPAAPTPETPLPRMGAYVAPSPPPTQAPSPTELAELKRAISDVREIGRQMEDTTQYLKELIARIETPAEQTQRMPDEENLNGNPFDLPAFRGVLNGQGKSIRLGELEKITGVTKEGLLLLASQPNSGIRVRGQWCSLIAA